MQWVLYCTISTIVLLHFRMCILVGNQLDTYRWFMTHNGLRIFTILFHNLPFVTKGRDGSYIITTNKPYASKYFLRRYLTRLDPTNHTVFNSFYTSEIVQRYVWIVSGYWGCTSKWLMWWPLQITFAKVKATVSWSPFSVHCAGCKHGCVLIAVLHGHQNGNGSSMRGTNGR